MRYISHGSPVETTHRLDRTLWYSDAQNVDVWRRRNCSIKWIVGNELNSKTFMIVGSRRCRFMKKKRNVESEVLNFNGSEYAFIK